MELSLLAYQESGKQYSSVETPVWFYHFLSLENVEILIKVNPWKHLTFLSFKTWNLICILSL